MNFPSLRLHLVRFSAAVLTFGLWATGPAHAATVLLNEVGPTIVSPKAAITSDTLNVNYGDATGHWNPGFRHASTATHTYLVVRADTTRSEQEDGFLVKIDPNGTVVWRRSMRELLENAGVTSFVRSISWQLNDISILNDYAYVIGENGGKLVIVAKIAVGTTEATDGVLEEYSLLTATDPVGGVSVGDVSITGNAIATSIVNGAVTITLAGDAQAEVLEIDLRNRETSPVNLNSRASIKLGDLNFNCVSAEGTFPDSFVLQLDQNLEITWGTTYGFPWSEDYATALTVDNAGSVYLAMKFENGDRRGTARVGDISKDRVVFLVSGVHYADGTYGRIVGVQSDTWAPTFDFWPGSWSIVLRLDTSPEPIEVAATPVIKAYFMPTVITNTENGSNSRVADMEYFNGSLYITGNWDGVLRPGTSDTARTDFNSSPQSQRVTPATGAFTPDVFVARLDATSLAAQNWRFYYSTGNDFANSLSIGTDGIYLSGVAGARLETSGTLTATLSGTDLGGATQPYVFWAKLSTPSLDNQWNVSPSSGGSITLPSHQRASGLGIVGEDVVISGNWTGGSITLGTSNAAKSLPDPQGRYAGFLGFLNDDGTWKTAIDVTINSAYGQPRPLRGVVAVSSGEIVTASVDPEVYVDAVGTILDPTDASAINARAVTRYIATGYQFRDSTVNGTANEVSFAPTEDTELTFLWRTEHAIEISSDIVGEDGLTSTAAGNPTPSVQKHWVSENNPFTAFVDGAATLSTEPGVRWVSTGYLATGSVAAAAGTEEGSMVYWSSFQERQQTPKITVGEPGSITWRWKKQYSVRVSANSSVASGEPTTSSSEIVAPAAQQEPSATSYSFDYRFTVPVKLTQLTLRAAANDLVSPTNFRIYSIDDADNSVLVATVAAPSLTTDTFQILSFTIGSPNENRYTTRWEIFPVDGSGNPILTNVERCDVSGLVIDPGQSSAGTSSRRGSGEFWFNAGSTITMSSTANVSSGLSDLALRGYQGGIGSVSPAESSSAPQPFVLNSSTALTWDYGPTIFEETVTLGDPISFTSVTGLSATNIARTTRPTTGTVSSGPTGSAWSDMQVWDDVADKLYPLRPGVFTVEFTNNAVPDDAARNIIIKVTAQWPGAADYDHVLEAPAVNLDPSRSDDRAFVELAYTEGRAAVDTSNGFTSEEPGRSVLIFSQRPGGTATGNLQAETLDIQIVSSFNWTASAGSARTATPIGQAITDSGHDIQTVGHNGYVLTALAPINAQAYNRDTLTGPIFPVNRRYPTQGRWATVTLPGPTTDTSSNLLASYTLDESSGNTAANAAGTGDATFYSDFAAPAFWLNPGANFQASFNQRFVSQNTSVGNGVTTALTLSAWIRVDEFENYDGIITKGTDTGVVYALGLWGDGRLQATFNYQVADTTSGSFTSDTAMATGQWYHVALTYDGSKVRFYLDGVQEPTEYDFTAPLGALNESLVIGADLPGDDEVFDGAIRDVRVYARALSANDIAIVAGGPTTVAASPGELAVAWYRVQDGIGWPYMARNYEPQWPSSPAKIVLASQLGSEGLSQAPFNGDGSGAVVYTSNLETTADTWRRPAVGGSASPNTQVRYTVQGLSGSLGNETFGVHPTGWSGFAFLYRDEFDPTKPTTNLIDSIAISDGATAIFGTVSETGLFYVVVSQDTSDSAVGPYRVSSLQPVVARPFQRLFAGTGSTNLTVYNQPDPNLPGYNPNEEHALIAPSFLAPSRSAAFALHNDLNRTSQDATYTSEPYVLVQYQDNSIPLDPQIGMAVYAISEEESWLDPRLPAGYQNYVFRYGATAGQRLVPPYPLDLVIGGSGVPEETSGLNVDDRISYYEDRDATPWVVSGDTDSVVDIEAAWYYPLRSDFWHATAALGHAVSLGNPALDSNGYNIDYDTAWPADVAVLKAGETLTFSGGEYATDHSSDDTAPDGLPHAISWQSGKLVFDDANTSLSPATVATQYLGRLLPVLTERAVDLALNSVPTALTPASGDVTVNGLRWYFDNLPASLKSRIFYDTSTQQLGIRGLLNDRALGDGDLLTTPGAQTILGLNIISDAAKTLLDALSSDSTWRAAVDALTVLSRDPNGTGITNALMAGLDRDPETTDLRPAPAFGPGLAVVTNPSLQNPGTSGTLPEGYITIAENDDPELTSPVAMHVIKISREKYRGSVAVLEPANVFDEKVSLRHTADFGGNVDNIYFQWFYREEDGRRLNPPDVANPAAGVASGSDWAVFAEGRGKNEVELKGLGPVIVRDNLFYARYGYSDTGAAPTEWSSYAGAANSREPNDASPSVATDTAYVAQLVSGWVKRVTAAVNAFDARFDDFRNNSVPATYTSMLQQAGQRYEGPVAFNPTKDAVENVGLIELYQTVLDRAEEMTISNTAGTSAVNVALLNAANRIAGLYVLLGDEAYADALDPTIGFATVGGDFGNLAPTIHAFENLTGSLLEEELDLLRGRAEAGARPAYNRLLWNFTNGAGEAAYVLNYGITDLTGDGFIEQDDAQRLYPQGHGDAWGHYTMALRGYYRLAQMENFAWEPRSELYNIDGVVVDIDYRDERTFARTAGARAQAGAEIVDLVYRQNYTENPNGQWQGYTDTDTDRAWGVLETAQRTGTAAFCDWLMANAVLPGVEADPTKTGIRKVDRTTVGDLRLIAAQGSLIQSILDSADRGLNPAGLDPNAIPFDIDPALTQRNNPNAATHFEQIYARAIGAATNARRTFDYANQIAFNLRKTEATSEKLREQAIDQDLSLRNQLIEVFGTPYTGTIGAGQAYPAGYNGPDLYLYLYVDQVAAGGDTLPTLSDSIIETTLPVGLLGLASDTNPFTDTNLSLDSALQDTASSYFPSDLGLPTTAAGEITLNLPRQASGYALTAPLSWGSRRSPGQIQAAIQELVQTEWQVRTLIDAYTAQADDFTNLMRRFELQSGIAADSLEVFRTTKGTIERELGKASDSFRAATVLGAAADSAFNFGDAIAEAFPDAVGLSPDVFSSGKAIAKVVGAIADLVLRQAAAGASIAEYNAQVNIEKANLALDATNLTLERKAELVDMLYEINEFVNGEGDIVLEIIDAVETMRSASNRVASTIEHGIALVEERTVFNQRVAATTTLQRYEDFTFRVFHTEALRKYRASFDLAARYAYLAGKAYQFELNLPANHAANASPLLANLLRERTLGQWDGTTPVIGQGGLAESLAVLHANYDTLKGQLGFNNPAEDVYTFSLRRELERVGVTSRANSDWRTALESHRVPDLWNYQYQNNGINYGYIFRRFCRPFAPESAGAQPALVIPFSTIIEAGKNWFGENLAGGDSTFNASNFSTKVRSVGVRFDAYNNTTLSQTPQVYLVPVGADRMFLPNSNGLEARSWNVVDRRIPAPLPISSANLTDPTWQPYSGSSSGFFEDIRKFSSFRAYHDAGGWSPAEMLNFSRHVGRSVWNTQWVLIIPNASLLFDGTNTQAGLDTLIHGAPLPPKTQSTATTSDRDGIGIRDITILLDTYSISGN